LIFRAFAIEESARSRFFLEHANFGSIATAKKSTNPKTG